jgi:ATP-binding cassette subfamily F protein 3
MNPQAPPCRPTDDAIHPLSYPEPDPYVLRIDNLTYRIAGRPILEGASVSIDTGHRVGLFGRNGAGKTTLLRLITGQLEPDSGSVHVPARARLGMTSQEAPDGPESLLETVLASDAELATLRKAADTETDAERLDAIHARLGQTGGYAAEARAARLLAGLGFDHAAQQRPCASFSGGWRMRVALAGLLFSEPDILLLDEPTNHLDLEATLWLEDYLRRYRGTVLIVSHDRTLLNSAVTEILHLDHGKLTLYAGSYDRFEAARRERAAQDEKLRKRQVAEQARIQKFVDRFRYKATKARQAQSRLKALARMEPIAEVPGEERTPISFPEPDGLAPPLISCDGVALGYGDNVVLSGLKLRLDPDDRIALLGANGNGKSTFIRFLADRLAPLTGEVSRPNKLRVGYFAQHQVDELDAEATPLMELGRKRPKDSQQALRDQLGSFGFGEEKCSTRIADLSGGEKARLLLSIMSCDKPHLLLLDEPTNHLDVVARELLVEALNEFPGAVIIVSHDPHLIEATADRLWLVEGGRIAAFDGDLADYKAHVLRGNDSESVGNAAQTADSKLDRRRERAETRQRVAPLRRQVREVEAKLTELERARVRLEAALADPSLYQGEASRVTDFNRQMAQVRQEIDDAEALWLRHQAALEEAEKESA